MNAKNYPCPQCGSVAVKRIVWTDDATQIATSNDPAVRFLSGPPTWNESFGADLICSACENRFWSDPARQEKDEEDTRFQQRRMAAMKRGEYMLFNPRTTSVDKIVDTVWQQVQRSKKAGAKATRAQKNRAKNGAEEKNDVAD